MSYTAIMKVENGRAAVLQTGFSSLENAEAHIDAHPEFPEAFAVATLAAPDQHWLCDPVAQTVAISPPASLETIPSRAEMKLALDRAFEVKAASLMQSEPGAAKALVFERRQKEAEARATLVAASGTPTESDYPALQALLGTSYGPDMAAVMAAVLAERDALVAALSAIDGAVVAAKDAIDAAADDAAAHMAHEAALTALA